MEEKSYKELQELAKEKGISYVGVSKDTLLKELSNKEEDTRTALPFLKSKEELEENLKTDTGKKETYNEQEAIDVKFIKWLNWELKSYISYHEPSLEGIRFKGSMQSKKVLIEKMYNLSSNLLKEDRYLKVGVNKEVVELLELFFVTFGQIG